MKSNSPFACGRFRSGLVAAFVALGFCVVSGVQGAAIFTNPITGTNPNTSNPYTTGQTVDPNLTVSGIGRGANIAGTNSNDRYNANSWNTGAIDPDAYFTFTITPNVGYEIDFTSFVYAGQASGTGPTAFAFRSSIDGFTTNLGAPTAGGATIDLSFIPNSSMPIEFRLYGWGASAAAGTFSVNDFEFNGEVVAVAIPEPSRALLVGLGVACFFLRRRRSVIAR